MRSFSAKRLAVRYVRFAPAQFALGVSILITCVLYVASTYVYGGCNPAYKALQRDCEDPENADLIQALGIIELCINIQFLMDFFLTGLYYPSFSRYMASSSGIIDFASSLPIVVFFPAPESVLALVLTSVAAIMLILALREAQNYSPHRGRTKDDDVLRPLFISFLAGLAALVMWVSQGEYDFHFLAVLKVFKAVRLVRLDRVYSGQTSELNSQVASLILRLITIVYLASCIVLEASLAKPSSFNDDNIPMAFHDAFYFVIITLSTVGYGDYVPTAIYTKLGVVFFVVFCFTYIPGQLARLQDIASNRSKYRSAFVGTGYSGGSSHVVLCGHLSMSSVQLFLLEYFHSERSASNEFDVVVLLCPGDTRDSQKLERLASRAEHSRKVHFIRGSPESAYDLNLANVHGSKAVYLLADLNNEPLSEEDYILISSISIMKYCWQHPDIATSKDMPVVAAETYTQNGARALKRFGVQAPISIEGFRATMLTYGVKYPGFLSLFIHLMRTESAGITAETKAKGAPSWLTQYRDGSANCIYEIPLPKVAERMVQARAVSKCPCSSIEVRWLNLGLELFGRSCVLLGALQGEASNESVVLNPKPDFVVNSRTTRFLYVIGEDEEKSLDALNESLEALCARGTAENELPGQEQELATFDGTKDDDSSAGAFVDDRLSAWPEEKALAETRDDASRDTLLLLPDSVSVELVAMIALRLFQIDFESKATVTVVHSSPELLDSIRIRFERLEEQVEISRREDHLRRLRFKERSYILDQQSLEEVGACSASEVLCLAAFGSAPTASNDRMFCDKEVILTAFALEDTLLRNPLPLSSDVSEPRNALSETNSQEVFTVFQLNSPSSIGFLRQSDDPTNMAFKVEQETYSSDLNQHGSGLFSWPLFAAGRVYSNSFLDMLIMPLSSCPIIWKLFFERTFDTFVCEPVAPRFVGRSYSELFRFCCEAGNVAMGLYRPPKTFGSFMAYTQTNPPGKTILVSGDRVFLIKGPSGKRTQQLSPWF